VLLLHGRNFPSSYWQAHDRGAWCAGYRVVVQDRLFNKSSKPLSDIHLDVLARNTTSLLDSLHIEQVDIVAHSMGGMLATRLRPDYPRASSAWYLRRPIGLEIIGSTFRRCRASADRARVEGHAESYRRWLIAGL
jgi:pimeloyl-ACP methyl ester carboxylesterase